MSSLRRSQRRQARAVQLPKRLNSYPYVSSAVELNQASIAGVSGQAEAASAIPQLHSDAWSTPKISGVVLGSVLGGVALLALIAFTIVMLLRRRKASSTSHPIVPAFKDFTIRPASKRESGQSMMKESFPRRPSFASTYSQETISNDPFCNTSKVSSIEHPDRLSKHRSSGLQIITTPPIHTVTYSREEDKDADTITLSTLRSYETANEKSEA